MGVQHFNFAFNFSKMGIFLPKIVYFLKKKIFGQAKIWGGGLLPPHNSTVSSCTVVVGRRTNLYSVLLSF